MKTLDPWLDAAHIAERLLAPGAELMVALGADGWCEKCKALRPGFMSLCASRAPANVVWLWLDLDEHEEFIGNFVPDDLPLVLRWREGCLVQAFVLEAINPQAQPIEQLRELTVPTDAPSLWESLSRVGWAQG